MVYSPADVQELGPADGVVQASEAQGCQELPYLLGDVLEEIDDELRTTGDLLAEFRILRCHPDRTGVEVADPHHHAT